MSYHYTCTRGSAKVELTIDIAQVIPYRSDGTVERNYGVIVVL